MIPEITSVDADGSEVETLYKAIEEEVIGVPKLVHGAADEQREMSVAANRVRTEITPPIHGEVTPGFERVREKFERNFAARTVERPTHSEWLLRSEPTEKKAGKGWR